MSSARQGARLCEKLLCPTRSLIGKGPDHDLSDTAESRRVDYGPQNTILFTSEINTSVSNEDKMKETDLAQEKRNPMRVLMLLHKERIISWLKFRRVPTIKGCT